MNCVRLGSSQNIFFESKRPFAFLLQLQFSLARTPVVSFILLQLTCLVESRDDIGEQGIRLNANRLSELFAVHVEHNPISAGQNGRTTTAATAEAAGSGTTATLPAGGGNFSSPAFAFGGSAAASRTRHIIRALSGAL